MRTVNRLLTVKPMAFHRGKNDLLLFNRAGSDSAKNIVGDPSVGNGLK